MVARRPSRRRCRARRCSTGTSSTRATALWKALRRRRHGGVEQQVQEDRLNLALENIPETRRASDRVQDPPEDHRHFAEGTQPAFAQNGPAALRAQAQSASAMLRVMCLALPMVLLLWCADAPRSTHCWPPLHLPWVYRRRHDSFWLLSKTKGGPKA